MGNSKFVQGSGKLTLFLILLGVVILAVAGGFFYYKIKVNQNLVTQKAPKLLEKGDYVVEERADGKYIVVDKVGLSAKVPDGWQVEFEGSDMPDGTSQYWVNLLSQDAEKTSGLLTRGCGISVLVGNNQDSQIVKNAIENMDNGMQHLQDTKPDFLFELTTISTKKAIKSTSPTRKIFGQSISVNVPIEESLAVIETRIPEGNESACLPVWEDFIDGINIK